MYPKRTLASTDDIPEKKRFRADVLDLTISSDISGQRAARLIQNAKLANTENINDLAKVPVGQNSARDLLRRCFRNSKWPDVYALEVPAWNPGKNVAQTMTLHMLLPHELMLAVLKVNSMEGLLRRQQLALAHRPDLNRHLGRASAQLGIDATKTLIAGFWVDSVPFNSDRTQSLEVFTFSLIGEGPMRFPICCFPKIYVKKHSSHDAILAVLAWSFRAALCGVCPSMRHDATAWRPTDKHRRRLQGKSAPIMILGELRGDWSMYRDLLDFPSWSSAGPICWRCDCTRAQLKDFTLASLTRLPCMHVSRTHTNIAGLKIGGICVFSFCFIALSVPEAEGVDLHGLPDATTCSGQVRVADFHYPSFWFRELQAGFPSLCGPGSHL